MVEHCLREAGVEGSNPFTPTIFIIYYFYFLEGLILKPNFSSPDFDLYVLNLNLINVTDLDYSNYLSPEEFVRFSKIKLESVKKSQMISQGFKRKILGDILDQDPRELIFKLGPAGKPYLDLDLNLKTPLFFNLSHAGDFVLLGVSNRSEIGVDIEKIKNLDYLNLAKRFFHLLEIDFLKQEKDLKKQERLFFKLWVYKEAYLKAIGLGISYGLDRFAIDPNLGVFLQEPQEREHQGYYLKELVLNNAYFSAVCWRPGEDSNLRPTP